MLTTIGTKTGPLEQFQLMGVSELDTYADIYCRSITCKYRGVIFFHVGWMQKWPIFIHPNADLLAGTYVEFDDLYYLQPDAIKFVNNNVGDLLCPRCNSRAMTICVNSKFNLKRISDSLKCHLQ